MRCPACNGLEDKVVDSRLADDGAAIRRRRECLECSRRFTTYERLEEAPLLVEKRSGHRVPFDRAKIVAGLRSATKNRPVSEEQLEAIALEIEDMAGAEAEITSERIGRAVLDRLQLLDEVAFLRFASVYNRFEDAGDFERAMGRLTKSTEPKQPG